MGAVAVGAQALGTAYNIYDKERTRKDLKGAQREAEARRDDLSQRREATYRYGREMLQGAIEDFYQSKGWPLPEKKYPGIFTTRGLPGEAPLYPEGEATTAGNVSAEDEDEASRVLAERGEDQGGYGVSQVESPRGVAETQPEAQKPVEAQTEIVVPTVGSSTGNRLVDPFMNPSPEEVLRLRAIRGA